MVSAEISLSTELGKEKLLAQVRSWVEGWVEKRFPENYPNQKVEIEYRRRAEFWTTQIEPAASLAVRITALTHDISHTEKDQKNRSAQIIARSLGGLRLPKEFVRGTACLVRDYETGGDLGSTLVRDAVSISFLEIKAPYLISRIPNEQDWQEVKEEIDSMHERIWLFKAREIANEPYKEAIARLEEKKKEIERLEKEKQQALAEYRRLVEEHGRKRSATDEEIDALHKARDRVLSLE